MLVLSRKRGDRICVGDGIVVTVLAIGGNSVRIGIEAPRDVQVDREEVRVRKSVERVGIRSSRPVPSQSR